MRNILKSHINLVCLRFSHPVQRCLSRLPALILLGSLLLIPNPINAQGFTSKGDGAPITRRLPAKVYLPGDSLTVRVTSDPAVSPQMSGLVKGAVQTGVSSRIPRLAPSPSAGSTDIEIEVQSVKSSSRVETRTVSEYQATGSHTVHDDATNTDQTVTDYGYVDVPHQFTIIDGALSAWYAVKDSLTGVTLDSGQLAPVYHQEFTDGVGLSASNPNVWLANSVASDMLSRVTPVPEVINLPLPQGKLKNAGKLFKAGKWDQTLDALTRMPALTKPADDAYRFYLIGLVQESKAYYSVDRAETRRLLDQATASYNTAIQMNAGEARFRLANARVAAAAPVYQEEADQEKTLEQAEAAVNQTAPSSGSRVPAPAHAGKPIVGTTGAQPYRGLSNDSVIDWVNLGIGEGDIVNWIKQSRQDAFDLSAGSQYELRRDGVTDPVLLAMAKADKGHSSGAGRVIKAVVLTGLQIAPLLIR